ncbi:MAG: GyrI-like domain-containing protein [Blastococcus sp.]
MTTEEPQLTDRPPQPAAVVRGHVATAELPEFLFGAYTAVMQALSDQHRPPSGPPFARYHETEDGFDVEAGFPTGSEIASAGGVASAVLPGGTTATALHRGSYDTVGEAYQVLTEWLTAHGYAPAGAPWESYLDEPGVSDPRTVVAFPCRRA